MKKREIYTLVAGLAVVAAVVLMLTFVVFPAGTEGVKEEAIAGSPAEGIAVHGHWIIDVRNPDGSVVTHREFDNALQTAGEEALAAILARQKTAGVWRINLMGTPTQPCMSAGAPTLCFACEASEPFEGSHIFKNLTVNLTGTGASAKVVLNGNVTVANTTNINAVETNLRFCDSTFSPADCAATVPTTTEMPGITYTTLSPTIPVTAGQQVQITVEISFS